MARDDSEAAPESSDEVSAYRGLAPGWYRDSVQCEVARYWDGDTLSDERRPVKDPQDLLAPNPPPGWYRDRNNPGFALYWDGIGFTGEQLPIAARPSAPPPARPLSGLSSLAGLWLLDTPSTSLDPDEGGSTATTKVATVPPLFEVEIEGVPGEASEAPDVAPGKELASTSASQGSSSNGRRTSNLRYYLIPGIISSVLFLGAAAVGIIYLSYRPTPPAAPSTGAATHSGPSATSAMTQAPASSSKGSVVSTTSPSTTQGPSSTSQAPSSTTQAPSSTTQGPSSTTQGPTTTAPIPAAVGPVNGGVHSMGATVTTPATVDGIVSATVYGFYPDISSTDPEDDQPPPGKTYGAIDAEECASATGSNTGADETDFTIVLSDGSSVGEPDTLDGDPTPLASESELGSSSQPLPAGQCDRGWIVFDIPDGTTPTYVEFDGTTPGGEDDTVALWTIQTG